ncbi:MAG TPA: hypothetical protein VFA21_21975 [Pyrinomonadaceae bacterium]|nr:hypothetical protein [Pyrinomonadaceae bacterium]
MATKKAGKKGATKKSAAPKGPSAADLKDLQNRLNTDARLRAQFLKDPGGVLRKSGVDVGADNEKQLAQFTNEMTAPQRQFFGAEIQREALALRIRITIIIRIGIGISSK